jgi:hypothetical protein
METARQILIDGRSRQPHRQLIKWTDVTMNATEFDMAAVPPPDEPDGRLARAVARVVRRQCRLARQAMVSDADYFVPWT